ncbi:hypothetical protein DLAC_05357 [Tieghemostelium lacteum]|uniref:Uncharacterized protein n=1 Tax=Tieghemostelium lacteum TaxID=361077 RepID=A0A151ZFN5_TIELA|nr:hypothetical protein DLAC_05357 [Tieghemostelium lacteum]|eukprot:KYQ92778.1 hypothetical protein DLAC_05357 [Tieghemostelium lacteum]
MEEKSNETPKLVIGLNKTQPNNLTNENSIESTNTSVKNTEIESNNNDTTAGSNNPTNSTIHTFKTGVITPQKPRALSPLANTKVRTVSFSNVVTTVEDNSSNINDNESDNNNNNNNNSINNKNNNNNSTTTDNSNIVNNDTTNTSINNTDNTIENTPIQSNSSLIYNQKQVFNKLNSGSNEIFQFDEECEEEIELENEKIKQQQLQQQLQQQQEQESNIYNNNTKTTISTTTLKDESSDEEDDEQQKRIVIGDNLRSRSNGLKQELKLGTSLPVFIPPRGSVPTHKGSVFDTTSSSINDKEKKKYVTPRQSWVEVLEEKDTFEASTFNNIPQSLSRKPKSFV